MMEVQSLWKNHILKVLKFFVISEEQKKLNLKNF